MNDHDVQNGHPSDVQYLWEAVHYLLALEKQGRILHGDIKKASEKFNVNYYSLAKRWKRNHQIGHNPTLERRGVAGQNNHPQNFNAHGRLFYSTLVLSLDHITGLPVCKRNRYGTPFWFGIIHQDFTIMAYPTGRVDVFPKALGWRDSCSAELTKFWDNRAVTSFMECLQVNGSKIELAVAIPGIPLGEFWQEKNNIISAHTDQTPKKGGNLELTINMGEFDQRLASMEKLLDQKLGGLSTSFVYTQIFAEIAQLRAAVNKLNELSVPSLNTANGSPSLGAPREAVSSASPAGSTGVLSDHSTPIFSSDSKSQLAIQLPGFDETLRKVSGAPDTGEPFCEKASPKIDPTLNEQLALDLGLVFKEGYARTAGVEPPTENCAVSGAPNPKRCPKCREYGLSMVYCGDILVCNKGEPMINPFRCFKDFVNCIRYQSGGKSGGYSDLVAANGDKIRRSMGYSVKRMGVGP